MSNVKLIRMFLVTMLLCFFLVGCDESSDDKSNHWIPIIPEPGVAVSPSVLAFGNVVIGESKTLPLTITNGTSEAITILDVDGVRGITSDSLLYTFTDNCGTTIFANGSCEVNVKYFASSNEAAAAKLTIALSSGTKIIDMSGTGVTSEVPEVSEIPGGSGVTTSPSSLAFGNVVQGTSKTLTVTLTNGSSEVTKLAAFMFVGAGEYTVTDDCGSPISANKTCTISVTLAPTTSSADWPSNGTLMLTLSSGIINIPVTGVGVKP